MIDTKAFLDAIDLCNIRFVTGVPDSLLKDVCAQITSSFSADRHIISSNEGSSVGLAIGHYLATQRPALVYMQNSGLGNIINPLTSLADPLVYSIPMLLLIGWRGEIQKNGVQLKDEPQHKKQGELTLNQLELLDIPYEILDKNCPDINGLMANMSAKDISRSGPVAIVVRKGTFIPFKLEEKTGVLFPMLREQVIENIVKNVPEDWPFICTTGVASRELFEIRKNNNQGHRKDFLTVGGMGHASSIAAGVAFSMPNKKVICIDGDGAALMHLGALAINSDCLNLVHILINNEAHDSVGGQPTKGGRINFNKVGTLLGYKHVVQVDDSDSLRAELLACQHRIGSVLIEVRCTAGFRSNLSRPDRTPIENKNDFMDFIRADN